MIVVRVMRDGSVVREVVCRVLPVTLGRGAECDVVLTDASVSRVHARVDKDDTGGLVLTDLGSRNGVRVGGRPQPSVLLAGVVRARIGRMELEIEPVSSEATLELRPQDIPAVERRRGPLHQAGYLALGVLGWLANSLLEPASWSPWLESRMALLLGQALGAIVLLPLLAFGLLVALKAAGRPARLADTLEAFGRLSWLLPLGSIVSLGAYYMMSPSAHSALEELLVLALVVVAVVTLAALRRPGPAWRFRLAWGVAVALFFLGIRTTAHIGAERQGTAQVSYDVQPPFGGWPGVSRDVEAHLTRVRTAARAAAADAETVRIQQQDD